MFVNGSGHNWPSLYSICHRCFPLSFASFDQNVYSLERTFHRCFLPSFSSFGWGVSASNIKMWKANERQTTDVKWWQKLTLPLAKGAKHRGIIYVTRLFSIWYLCSLKLQKDQGRLLLFRQVHIFYYICSVALICSESGQCVRVGRHVHPWMAVSVS